MKHDLQLPVSIWNLLPVWYYRNKGEVENIYGYTWLLVGIEGCTWLLMVIEGYTWLYTVNRRLYMHY